LSAIVIISSDQPAQTKHPLVPFAGAALAAEPMPEV
jgi:hypothetical protein